MATETIPRHAKRTALVEAALAAMVDVGPFNLRPAEICERLGLSKALVNYHFGSREGLVAEAMAIGYERYVATLEAAVAEAGDDPMDRLMAFYSAQVYWTIDNAGLAAALNFPRDAAGVGTEIDVSVQQRLTDAGASYLSTLLGLVGDARRSLGHDDDPSTLVSMTAMIGWSCLGASVWFSGGHAPSREIGLRPEPAEAICYARGVIEALLAT
jgi:AcrR family transcriptional regulator